MSVVQMQCRSCKGQFMVPVKKRTEEQLEKLKECYLCVICRTTISEEDVWSLQDEGME
jgi:hypothetical protein